VNIVDLEAQSWDIDPAVAMYGPLARSVVAPTAAIDQNVGNVVVDSHSVRDVAIVETQSMRDAGDSLAMRDVVKSPATPTSPDATVALQRHKAKLIGALVSQANAATAAKKALRHQENVRRERIDAHRRQFGPGYMYELDDDGVHFRALEELPETAAAAMEPVDSPTRTVLKSILKPARVVNRPVQKGAKSERVVPFRDYTAVPRRAGRPVPRVGADLTSRDYVRVRRLIDNSPAARRARVGKMRLAAAKPSVAPEPFEITVAAVDATLKPDVPKHDPPPRHFFADWLVKGVAGRVRISLDSGSDVSTVEEGHLSAALRETMLPLPAGLSARAFDGSSADMSNFVGIVSLSLQLGAFTTTTDFYVVKRGMAPFVLSKFVQAEMGATFDYKTWEYHAAERKRVSKETFDVTLDSDVVVCGPMAVRCRVLVPERLLGEGDDFVDLHVSPVDVTGVASATTNDSAGGMSADCVSLCVANTISRARVVADEAAVLQGCGRNRTRRMRWCFLPVNILCNSGCAALAEGQVLGQAGEMRSKTTFYRFDSPPLSTNSTLPSRPTVASTTVLDADTVRNATAEDLALHDESTIWYDDDVVAPEIAAARIRAKIDETIADSTNGCTGLVENEAAIRLCLEQMHLGPDEDGKIGAAAFGVEHVIDGPERFRPIARRNYQYSHEEIVFIEDTIKTLLKQGVIEKAATPWVSPIVIATHPRTGKLRFCVDYRGVNSLTIADAYSLPRIKQVFEAVSGMAVLSIVDVAQAFPHVPIAADSKKFTGFRGPRNDLYQYVGSPFGLASLPATWQRYMETMFSGLLWKSVCIYVDDILVFSADVATHIALLTEVFRVLREHNLALRVEKCHFFKREVEYLGFLLSADGVRAVPASVAKILECPAPVSKSEIRRFMGMAEQYRSFIPDFAALAKPLSRLQGKAKKGGQAIRFQWGEEEATAFEALKRALASTPVLTLPDLSRPFRIYIDASEFAMGAVLCQLDADSRERVIGYYSKMMNPAQVNYSVSEKECLAVHHFITTLRHFFAGGGPHELFTDHSALTALTKGELHNRRMIRWATDLASFNFVIRHIPGSTMPADALTKGPVVRASDDVMRQASQVSPLGTAWIDQTQSATPQIAAVTWSEQLPGDTTLIAKLNLGGQTLLELQQADPVIAPWREFVGNGRPLCNAGASKEEKRARQLIEKETRGMIIDARGYLVRYMGRSTGGKTLFVAPASMIDALLVGAHRGTQVGIHAGVGGEGMRRLLSESYYWPTLQRDCVRFVPSGKCETCLAANRAPGRPAGLLHHLSVGRAFEYMAMDCVPMPLDDEGFCQMCVFVCCTTRFPVLVPLKESTSISLAKAYIDHVLPLTGGAGTAELWADSGSNQSSVLMRDFVTALGIEPRFAFPQHQQADGAETTVKRTKEVIRRTLLHLPTTAWRGALPAIALQLMCTEGRTGVSPYEAVFGRKPMSQLDVVLRREGGPLPQREARRTLAHHIDHVAAVQSHVREAVQLSREDDEAAYNRGRSDKQMREGDFVLLKEKIAGSDHNLAPTFGLDVFKVVEIHSDVSILIKRCTSQGAKSGSTKRSLLVNIDALRKLSCNDEPSEWRISRVHDHRDVVTGREYLIEFPGLGDKRQFRWEAEAKLLETPGNDEPLVAYDRLRDAERRAIAVPAMREDDAVSGAAAVAAPRQAGRRKKVQFVGPIDEEDVVDDGVAAVVTAAAEEMDDAAPVAVPAAARPVRARRESRKVRDNALADASGRPPLPQ
jgi:hypothetical protein